MERRTFADRRATQRGGRRYPDFSGRPVILIVDDHVDSRELMAAVLNELGVVIAEAGTGAAALERARSHPAPTLILIDLSLPDCHGTDVVRALKDSAATRDIPIAAFSASVMPAAKEAAATAGCAAFIEKPMLPEDVLAMVRRLLAADA